jgi:hypothetical protein
MEAGWSIRVGPGGGSEFYIFMYMYIYIYIYSVYIRKNVTMFMN